MQEAGPNMKMRDEVGFSSPELLGTPEVASSIISRRYLPPSYQHFRGLKQAALRISRTRIGGIEITTHVEFTVLPMIPFAF